MIALVRGRFTMFDDVRRDDEQAAPLQIRHESEMGVMAPAGWLARVLMTGEEQVQFFHAPQLRLHPRHDSATQSARKLKRFGTVRQTIHDGKRQYPFHSP